MLNFRGVSVCCVFYFPCFLLQSVLSIKFLHGRLRSSEFGLRRRMSTFAHWKFQMECDGICFISSGRELKIVYDMV